MTYRDELGQAHQRIEQLQRELEDERARHAAPPPPNRRHHCLLPETFRDATGILITAEGSLSDHGVFEASQIIVPWPDMFPGMR